MCKAEVFDRELSDAFGVKEWKFLPVGFVGRTSTFGSCILKVNNITNTITTNNNNNNINESRKKYRVTLSSMTFRICLWFHLS